VWFTDVETRRVTRYTVAVRTAVAFEHQGVTQTPAISQTCYEGRNAAALRGKEQSLLADDEDFKEVVAKRWPSLQRQRNLQPEASAR
jgi:hypothetical protein